MTVKQIKQISTESLVKEFFLQSAGEWLSQRRYYTLKQDVEPQEVVSHLKVNFLPQGDPQLLKLAELHQLENDQAFFCGSHITWKSDYVEKTHKPSQGSTIFGVLGNILYRDQGFATTEPVQALYFFTNPNTLCLKTEYKGSIFEEELKLIGENYRTRQTIISRAGEEIMIGQYLEKRIIKS